MSRIGLKWIHGGVNLKTYGGLHILVNNADHTAAIPFSQSKEEEWEQALGVG